MRDLDLLMWLPAVTPLVVSLACGLPFRPAIYATATVFIAMTTLVVLTGSPLLLRPQVQDSEDEG